MATQLGTTQKALVAMALMIGLGLYISLAGATGMGLAQVVLIVAGIGLALWVGATRPVDYSELVAVSQSFAKGNFSASCASHEADGRGAIALALNELGKTVQQFKSAQQTMMQRHAEGWIDDEIDAAKLPGAFGEIGASINQLVKSHIAVKMQIVDVVTGYAKGDYSRDMERLPGKKATITAAIDVVRDQLKAAAKANVENSRIKMALDATSTSAMIADVDGQIIYMNNSVSKLLTEAESDIRKDLPDFRAAQVVGGNISRFHKNPAHQTNVLSRLTAPHVVDINVGGRAFGLVATPMFGAINERLGTVVEWKDRAAEIEAAKQAAFNLRIRQALDYVSTPVRISDSDGTLVYINNALKETLVRDRDAFSKSIPGFDPDKIVGGSVGVFYADPAAAMQRLHAIDQTIVSRLQLGGRDYDVITSPIRNVDSSKVGTVGQWVDVIDQLIAQDEIGQIVEAASAGNFTRRIEPEGKSGFYLQLTEGMNRLMDTSETGLNEVVRVLRALAAGDLTERITADYSGTFGELKEYSNSTSEQLAGIIGEVRNAAEALTSASEQVSSTAQSLAQSASEQAAGVERTSSSVEQLSSSVAQNTENAKVTDGMATKSATDAVEGGEAVNRTADAMKQIANKVSIIDDIADQTNLLALNAAIEAARAGASGKGFAVVAAEVRKLAERSQIASKEIGELATASVQMSETAGRLLTAMIPSIRKTSDLVQEISAASDEQTNGLGHISTAMNQLNQATQQNAAASEQLAATAEEMSGQAGALQQLMDFFKVEEGAKIRTSAEPARRVKGATSLGSGGTAARKAAVAPTPALIDESQFKRF